MVTKYIVVLYIFNPDLNYSLSIRKDIGMAKQILKYHGISDPDLCTGEHISELCSNNHIEVCSARLIRKKMEFKQFENPCYMDLNNICESQDNIWAIKNSGPCVMNEELRRFAKEIEKMADDNTDHHKNTDHETDETTTPDDTATDETDLVKDETTTDGETATEVEEVTDATPEMDVTEDVTAALSLAEDENDETTTTDETVTDETTTDDINTAEDENDETTTTADTVTDETTTDDINTAEDATETLRKAEDEDNTTKDETTIAGDENATEDTIDATETNPETTIDIDEIGKIYYDDGSIKSALREAESTRFPPMRAKKSWDKKPCEKRVKCPNIYYPVCLFYAKEKPNNITYYYFINSCEAQQYTCYHPEHTIDGSSSVRAGFCAHIQYLNYARFFHTMSAWGHYGWLHGPWPFNHILKPNQRA